MAVFNRGEEKNIIAANGEEIIVSIHSAIASDWYLVQPYSPDGQFVGNQVRVHKDKLLRLKGPFFDVRGLVLTTSVVHRNQEGEIIALGNGPKGKQFYCVQFEDDVVLWFSEDQVWTEASTQPADNVTF